MNSAHDVCDFFRNSFAKNPVFGALNLHGIAPDKEKEFIEIFKERHYESRNTACVHPVTDTDTFVRLPQVRNLITTLHRCTGYGFDDFNDMLNENRMRKRIPTASCLPFDRKVYLTVNGKILPCERIGHSNAFGHVNEDGVTLDVAKVAETTNQHFDTVRDMCAGCYNVDTCDVCYFTIGKRLGCESGQCASFMTREEFSKALATQVTELEASPLYYAKIMDEVSVI
jgi:uncharacterized protein